MPNKYNIKYTDNKCIEISKPNSSVLVYKIPYEEIKKAIIDIDITNRFIVYILIGKDNKNNDIIYVGKSKNGIDQRPTAHEDEDKNWHTCFVLTTFNEKTFFNDGVIQYIENTVHKRILKLNNFATATKVTNCNTINVFDTEDCDDYIEEAYKMLYVLGLNLIIKNNEPEATKQNNIESQDGITNICKDILSNI